MTKHSARPRPQVPPPEVPLDQTEALMHWEGRDPPSDERRNAWDYRLVWFLGRLLQKDLRSQRPG